MALVSLFAFVDTEQALAVFSHAHARDHDDIDNALIAKGLLALPIRLPLDPIPLGDGGAVWASLHQQKHNEMNGALGLSGEDMTQLDLRDVTQREEMIGINFAEHDSVHQALSI